MTVSVAAKTRAALAPAFTVCCAEPWGQVTGRGYIMGQQHLRSNVCFWVQFFPKVSSPSGLNFIVAIVKYLGQLMAVGD